MRVKIKFPDEKPLYVCTIAVRIGDVNYGGHVGNDSMLSIVHEARLQMLQSWCMTELDADGSAMIMADAMVAYKGESFYGDMLKISVWSAEVTPRSFDLLYRISAMYDGRAKDIAHVKTGMVIFDYSSRKVGVMGAKLTEKLKN